MICILILKYDLKPFLQIKSFNVTCELQVATQRAADRRQQRQAGMFGLGILQILDQWDGRVLDKLHQQLRRGHNLQIYQSHPKCMHSCLQSRH